MVAIRPPRVEGTQGQKVVALKRFSGDGFDFQIGDVIRVHPSWVHKVPMFVGQNLITTFLTEEQEQAVPVNQSIFEPKAEEPLKDEGPTGSGLENEPPVGDSNIDPSLLLNEKDGNGVVDENSEVDDLAASLM